MKRLKITIQGKTYQVTVEPLPDTHTPQTTNQPTPPTDTTPTNTTTIPSPLAGKVLQITTKNGQQINQGDQLLILEAMKMNTYIYAPKNGQIHQIHINEGDTVEEHQPLITLR